MPADASSKLVQDADDPENSRESEDHEREASLSAVCPFFNQEAPAALLHPREQIDRPQILGISR